MPKPTLDDEWKDRVRGILKVVLARCNVKQTELASMLEKAYRVKESPQSWSNKIRIATFSAIFMFQILEVIGCESLNISATN